MIKTYKLIDLTAFFMAVLFICILALYPDISIEGAKSGVSLALYTVIPSVFPFMVICKYLMYSGYAHKLSHFTDKLFYILFKIPIGSSVAFLIGILSGYPIGGVILSELVKQKAITKENASYMLGYCNNCSPVFIIGTVGSIMLKNVYTGYILYIIHLTSAIILAFFTRNKIAPQIHKRETPAKEHSAFTKSVSDSSISVLNISCYIVFFSVVSALIKNFINFNQMFSGIASGILEISNGINLISKINIHYPLKLAVISAILGFSGFCVLFQTSSVIYKSGISIKEYFKSKLKFSLISFVLTFIFFTK